MKCFFFWAILLPFFTFSQSEVGTVYFKDGSVIQGLVKLKKNGEVKYLNNNTKETNIYNHRAISEVKVLDNSKLITYTYKIIKGQKKPKWVMILMGKSNLCLYGIMKNGSPPIPIDPNSSNPQIFTPMSSTIKHFVGKRTESSIHSFDKTIYDKGKNRIERLLAYFRDCPGLCKKIEKKELNKHDLQGMVEYYNKNCN